MPKLCFFDDFHPESDGGKRNEQTSKWGKKHIFLSILSLKTLPFKQKYVSLVALFLDIFFLHCASMTDSQTANSERQKVSELFLLLFFLFFVPVTLLPVPTSYFPSFFRGIIYHFGVRCPLTLHTCRLRKKKSSTAVTIFVLSYKCVEVYFRGPRCHFLFKTL